MSDTAVARRAPVERDASVLDRIRGWWSNPWGKPRFLTAFVWMYIAWSLIPVLIAVQFGFNDGRSRTAWQGFSTRWYVGDPDLSVWHDPALRDALFQSLRLASLTMLIATPLGVALAIGLARWHGRGAKPSNMLMLFPLVTPEIVMGVALFLVFIYLFDFVSLGTQAQTLGHVTFTLSYVVIVVRARLLGIGREYEEAAMDLGASHLQAVRYVLFPILRPAILASLMIAFAISIDDFVISQFLQATQKSTPIPVLIYSAARLAPTPALNAIASILLTASLLSILAAMLILRHFRRREGGAGTTIEDFARLDLGSGQR
jgi:spermidine/putrescine transport system permease protein